MRRDSSVPKGRLRRLARLARLGTETGASILLSRDPAAAAEHAAEALGALRGLATKVGQMASYVDGLVPESHEAVFEEALKELRNGAPRSPSGEIRRVVEAELGAPIEALFDAWEDEPFASASIGQVHAARLGDGRRVAVKVQHPGIEQAVEGDLANGQALARLVGAVAPDAFEAERVYAEVANRFRDELDYRREAGYQRRFAALFAEDPRVVIPAVIDERSSQRVLTSVFEPGDEFEVAMLYPEPERRAAAELLWRFVYRSILVGGVFNADPHPGNTLFRRDGTIVFLDFGCVQELTRHVHVECHAAHAAAVAHDETGFARHAARIIGASGGPYEAAFVAYLRRCVEPVFASPFRITRPYARGLVTGLQELKKRAFDRHSGFVPLPESTVLLNRLQVGFFSVLARLDVEADYAKVEREFLQEFHAGP
jgi:predicted unusual protein kinase regulating ubiquinone biosynthesis (AarF/ABC1/UbiB family)